MNSSATLQQYHIADFIEWHSNKKIILNPYFQRRNVWNTPAKSYLIDTILRNLPIPKIYLRTKIDLETRQSIREVVDGQQRLRAIFDFATDKFPLDKRSKELSGLRYSDLDDELKGNFLEYTLSVEQLINASNNDVLEIFARLNSYNMKLNAAELRHAEFQNDFKWAVHYSAQKWSILWEEFEIVNLRRRVRMIDDEFMARLYGILIKGIIDGSQSKINSLYRSFNIDANAEKVPSITYDIDRVLDYIVSNLSDVIEGPIAKEPHFLILFAAIAFVLVDIPVGEMGANMPQKNINALSNLDITKNNILFLAELIDSDDVPQKPFQEFWNASKQTTHSLKSRVTRFPVYVQSLLPQDISENWII